MLCDTHVGCDVGAGRPSSAGIVGCKRVSFCAGCSDCCIATFYAGCHVVKSVENSSNLCLEGAGAVAARRARYLGVVSVRG